MKPRILTSIFATMAFGLVSANAATISFSDTTSVTETNLAALTGVNQLTVSKFNPALGTLTKVELTITLFVPSFVLKIDNDSVNTVGGFVNFGTLGGTSFFSSAATLDGLFTNLSGTNFGITTQSSAFTVDPNAIDAVDIFNDDVGVDHLTFNTGVVTVGQTTPRVINDVAWNQYSGLGDITFDLGIDFVSDLNVNSGGGGGETRFQGSVPSATFASTVTYTYTAIPEPSAALLGGLGVLGLLRRRRY